MRSLCFCEAATEVLVAALQGCCLGLHSAQVVLVLGSDVTPWSVRSLFRGSLLAQGSHLALQLCNDAALGLCAGK